MIEKYAGMNNTVNNAGIITRLIHCCFTQTFILVGFGLLTLIILLRDRIHSFVYCQSSDEASQTSMPKVKVPKSQSSGSTMTDFNANIINKLTPTDWEPRVLPIDFDRQAIVDISTGERFPRFYSDSSQETFQYMTSLYPEATTMLSSMERGYKKNPISNCLGRIDKTHKTMIWQNYQTVWKAVQDFGNGLQSLLAASETMKNRDNSGFPGSKVNCVGIYSINRPEYVISEYGAYWHSYTVVPIYDTLGPNALSFIVNQAEIECIICDKLDRVQLILSQASAMRSLKYLIVFDDIPESYKQKATNNNIKVFTFDEILKKGTENSNVPSNKPTAETLALICYTSGTTDTPKGVMLTHGNVVANVSAVMYQMMEHTIRGSDILMSYLPLAHMFERNCENALFMEGGAVAYYGGDVKTLSDDMKIARPTLLPAVPRLLTRIFCKIQDSVKASFIKSFLLNTAFYFKQREIEKTKVVRNDTFWDKLVFHKIRETLGGRVRLILSGSAPLNPNVFEFLRCTLGCVVTEGYGQTECVAPCTLTFPSDIKLGHVGGPLSCASIKLVDVPEMGYLASQGKGEVLVRGPIVFKGYFKDPERTKLALDDDGWLHTGDIGMWTENETLRIIDRKKNIFKLSQGEYIAPEKIENVYGQCAIVAQIFVYGESIKSSLVAIVVPDQVILEMWAKNNGINGNFNELCANKTVKKMLMKELITLGKREGLKSFEQVKDILIHSDLFTIENGLLTPTMKSKRNEIYKRFQNEINQLYSNLE